MDYRKVKKFVSIVVNKDVDITDIKESNDYTDYFENMSFLVDTELLDKDKVLDEKEYALAKEVIKEYAK